MNSLEKKEKAKEKGKDIPNWMQSCRDEQEEIKKDFLSNQCTEIEKNNKMGETRDLFKKIIDT